MANTIQDRVIAAVSRQLKVPAEEIQLTHHLVDELGADSLDTVELLMDLEEEFEIEITDEEAEKLETVQSVIDFVTNRTA